MESKKSKIDWQKLVEDLPLGISVQNLEGEVIYANKRAFLMSHAKKTKDLVYPFLKNKNVQVRNEKGKRVRADKLPGSISFRTLNSEKAILEHYFPAEKRTRWPLVKSFPLLNSLGKVDAVVNCLIDLTKIKSSEKALATLVEITGLMAKPYGYLERIQTLADNIVPKVADWCAIDILDSNAKFRRVVVAAKDTKKVKLTWKLSTKYLEGFERNKEMKESLLKGKPLLFSDLSILSEKEKIKNKEFVKFIDNLELRSVIISPIKVGEKLIGLLNLAYTEPQRSYNEEDILYMNNLTDHASILVENARLFEQTKKRLNVEREIKRRLKEYQSTLKLAQIAGKMGFWEWDLESDVIHWSENFEILHGINIGDFSGTLAGYLRLIHPEDRPVFERKIKESMSQKNNFELEYRTFPKEIASHWIFTKANLMFDQDNNATRLVGVGMDITMQKKSQQVILENEKKFKAIYEHATDAIIILNKKGVIYDVNPFTHTLFSLDKKDLRNTNIRSLIKFIPDQEKGELEISLKKSGVKYFEYNQSESFLKELNLLIIHDITDKKIEEKRREHFLGIAGHELKSPLAAMKAYLHIMRKIKAGKLKETFASYLDKIDKKSDLLLSLINELLDVTRIGHGKLDLNYEIVDFDGFVKDVVKDFSLIYHEHDFKVKGRTGKEVVMDRIRITQVFYNFLKNSVKYSPGKNKIIVELDNSKGKVIISIKDFGIGINKRDLKKIFELYYRAPKKVALSPEGLGVGLFITYQIIKAHGGTVKVFSKEGKGSIFRFTLPLRPKYHS